MVERRSPKPDAGGSSPSWPAKIIDRSLRQEKWVVVSNAAKYYKETMAELRKMTWPTKEELIGSTIVTIVVSLIVAIFIGIVDRLLTLGINAIFSGRMGG